MKALVLGYGRSGKAAEALLRAQGHDVDVLDERDSSSFKAQHDVAIVSPGIPMTHPWIEACVKGGMPIKSELQLGCETLRGMGVRMLGVTGSKGKSSVVKLVADAMTRSGGRGIPCGNYGMPVCDVALELLGETSTARMPSRRNEAVAVVEVSSFMMETTELPADTFEAAAVLNLQEDHLDRHGSVAAYHALKMKLLSFARKAICGRSCGDIANVAKDATALLEGSYFDNAILRENGECAVALMRAIGLGDAAVRTAFVGFEPLPHRMNLVAEIAGVRYVDDSKATSLAALAAGVKMCPGDVRLIAGGLPKGDDPKSVLETLTNQVKKVYLMGRCARAFYEAWSTSVDCEICETLSVAVGKAKRESVAGETVLLSPGTASFDQFKSFEERGDVFANLVLRESHNT